MSLRSIKLKIPVIGPPHCGKSSFISNLVNSSFTQTYTPTIDYQITLYEFKNNSTNYEIQLWECGCKHFENNKFLRKAFFRNSSAVLLLFDLCDPKWKENLVKWIEEAYQSQAFLVYAIGTKKDIFEKKTLKEKLKLIVDTTENDNNDKTKQHTLYHQGIQEEQLNSDYEYENNVFFDQYQIRHFYQSATQKISYQIKNIFITIHDDRQKLTRSSLARGTKFDNSLIQNYISKIKDKQSSPSKNSRNKELEKSSANKESLWKSESVRFELND